MDSCFPAHILGCGGAALGNSDESAGKIYRIHPANRSVVSILKAPTPTQKGGSTPLGGLTWDGDCLWSGSIAGWSSRASRIDPEDGSLRRFSITKGAPRALACDGHTLWSASNNGGIRLALQRHTG